MNLEDHLGDIISKARDMSNVSAAAAANAAGISEGELAALEESGKAPGKMNYAALAPLIGLNAAKLEGIAKGWLPVAERFEPVARSPRVHHHQRGHHRELLSRLG